MKKDLTNNNICETIFRYLQFRGYQTKQRRQIMSEKQWTSKKGQSIKFLKVQDLSDIPFVGIFVESYKGGKYDTLNHKFKATSNIELSDGSTIAEGDMVIINGVGSLNSQMEQVLEGEETRVEYLGQSEMKTGQFKGTKAHNVEVLTSDAPVSDISEYKYEA